jgi:hypothetical protein
MPTIIDSLVLEVGLDPTRFTQQQREAVNSLRSMEQEQLAAGKRVESEARRIGNILTDFRRNALQVTSLFLGGMGIQQFTNYITTLDANAGRLGRTMNMSAQDVTVWQGAIKQVGGTVEEANTSLSAMSEDMNHFQLTGQSAMLPVLSRLGVSLYDQNQQLKTAGQLWIEITDAIAGMDRAQATSFLRMLPGATQGMINLALLGPGKLREYLEVQRQLGAATKQSADEAEKYQRALVNVESAATNLGRTIVTSLAPALVSAFDAMTKFIKGPSEEVKADAAAKLGWDTSKDSWWEKTASRIFRIPTPRGNQYHWREVEPTKVEVPKPVPPAGEDAGAAAGGGASRSRVPLTSSPLSTTPSPEVMEKSIRDKFSARGIDPDIAVRVAKSEGLFAYKYSPTGQSFVPGEQSFGPFQLNYSPKGTSLGDRFTRETGLDARNPATVDKQIEFVAEWVRKNGWGDFHGWKGDRFAGINREGAAPSTTTVTIGTLNVNGAQVKDAQTFGDTVGPALKRSVTAGAANSPF